MKKFSIQFLISYRPTKYSVLVALHTPLTFFTHFVTRSTRPPSFITVYRPSNPSHLQSSKRISLLNSLPPGLAPASYIHRLLPSPHLSFTKRSNSSLSFSFSTLVCISGLDYTWTDSPGIDLRMLFHLQVIFYLRIILCYFVCLFLLGTVSENKQPCSIFTGALNQLHILLFIFHLIS